MHHARVLLLLLGAGLLAGCGGSQPTAATDAPAERPSKTIGVSLLTQTHVFFQDLAQAMRDAAGEHGYRIDLQYAEFDGARQNNHMETFILQYIENYDQKGRLYRTMDNLPRFVPEMGLFFSTGFLGRDYIDLHSTYARHFVVPATWIGRNNVDMSCLSRGAK